MRIGQRGVHVAGKKLNFELGPAPSPMLYAYLPMTDQPSLSVTVPSRKLPAGRHFATYPGGVAGSKHAGDAVPDR